jgi:hypothetical protein
MHRWCEFVAATLVVALLMQPAIADSPTCERTKTCAVLPSDFGLFKATNLVATHGSVTPDEVRFGEVPASVGDFPVAFPNIYPNSLSSAAILGSSHSPLVYDLYGMNLFSGSMNWRFDCPDIGSTLPADDANPFNETAQQNANHLLTLSMVPEPSGLLALGTGIIGLLGYSVRRRRAS